MSREVEWNKIADFLEVLKSSMSDTGWTWARNSRCKYVEMRVDMRSGHCVLRDRDGNLITLEELKYQYGTEEPTP